MELLSKTRVMNQLLQRADGMRVSYEEMTASLRDLIFANVFLVDDIGRMLGRAFSEMVDVSQLPKDAQGTTCLPNDFAAKLLSSDLTRTNLQEDTPFCSATAGDMTYVSIVPIRGTGERIGTLLLTKQNSALTEEDIILAEYSASLIGLEMVRASSQKKVQEGRDRSVVQMAVGSLSFSELEAVDHIFAELNGREGLLVASRIADRVGITRSVIVNALRKLESAGVVEARSLGMKGTHIKILNEKLLPLLEDMKSK
ncbi:GTP-sensing pleiotropic transcriptional regulator CodY [Tumebacillus algifaecis]|uniref:Global transcriptional regulator CodY n=1 Tax=Tumebacillus algifaecis TaxID=1214604 RepID=A0A223D2D4_9BACL|nr:GTP-sensing pleiotropic transcriptional regulator CodY [Tumebacillus algifaecis]ASS75655.1 GTP-sensing pleiotropic transcriptional regulator CodY [Tumebacillus algifaecis]